MVLTNLTAFFQNRATHPQVLPWNFTKFYIKQVPIIPNTKCLFCMHEIHTISLEIKKVTLKNFIRDFIFLTAAQTLCIGRHSIVFSTKRSIQTFLIAFSSFSPTLFAQLKNRLLRLYSHCHLLFVQSRMDLVCRNQENFQVTEAATGGVLEKRCSQKFRKIHRKTLRSRPEARNFIKKETLAQVFSCAFCEISKNIFFIEHPGATPSEVSQNSSKKSHLMTNWNHSLYVHS